VEHDGPHDDAAARLKGERHRPKGLMVIKTMKREAKLALQRIAYGN
jgi:hypothetical protein